MARRQDCAAGINGQICVTSYTKTARVGDKLTINLNRKVFGRVIVEMSYAGPGYCGDRIVFSSHPHLTVFDGRVVLTLAEEYFWPCGGKTVTVEQMLVVFVDEPSYWQGEQHPSSQIRIDTPGITIKPKQLNVTAAKAALAPGAIVPMENARTVTLAMRPARGSGDRRAIGRVVSGRGGCTSDADCPGATCFCRNGQCVTTDPLGCMPDSLAARPKRQSKQRATIPRSGCTPEQIEAGCMWRNDLGRCQCPSPQRLVMQPFQPKGAERPHGSLVIFPKTLQAQTVQRRYPKRRPGR